MPALVPGRCNWCGGALRRDQLKLCSDACRAHWRREMMVLGHKVAERAVHAFAQRTKPKSANAKRGFSEMDQLVREFWLRLRQMQMESGNG